MSDMQAKLQLADDRILWLEQQRNNALTEGVHLGAQLLAAQRKIKELEEKLAPKAEPELPLSNGRSIEAHAVQ